MIYELITIYLAAGGQLQETIADYHVEASCEAAAREARKVFDAMGTDHYLVYCHERDGLHFADDARGQAKPSGSAAEGRSQSRVGSDTPSGGKESL